MDVEKWIQPVQFAVSAHTEWFNSNDISIHQNRTILTATDGVTTRLKSCALFIHLQWNAYIMEVSEELWVIGRTVVSHYGSGCPTCNTHQRSKPALASVWLFVPGNYHHASKQCRKLNQSFMFALIAYHGFRLWSGACLLACSLLLLCCAGISPSVLSLHQCIGGSISSATKLDWTCWSQITDVRHEDAQQGAFSLVHFPHN
jgi:hypothetical protein